MKGFSPRERIGLISLALVVAGCFILGMIGWEGCSHRFAVENGSREESVAMDSTASAEDSIRDSRRIRGKMDNKSKKGSKGKKGKKKKEKKEQAPAERRSLRDEKL